MIVLCGVSLLNWGIEGACLSCVVFEGYVLRTDTIKYFCVLMENLAMAVRNPQRYESLPNLYKIFIRYVMNNK